jgi:hypothetical protein
MEVADKLYVIKKPDGMLFTDPDGLPMLFDDKEAARTFVERYGACDEPGWTFPAVRIVEVPDGVKTA